LKTYTLTQDQIDSLIIGYESGDVAKYVPALGLLRSLKPNTDESIQLSYVWAAISKTMILLFSNEEDARKLQPTATSLFDIQRMPLFGSM
jgi:hypothetical protein